MAESGVDESTHALLSFGSGAVSLIDCSMRIPESAGLHIVGTEGQIEIPQPWFPHLEPRFWLVDRDGKREAIEAPGPSSYFFEIDNFIKAATGQVEPAVDRDLSTRVAATLALIATNAVSSSA
jgi:predicted dehydrogenase